MKTQRYRITFSKTKAMRFTGHLDLILTWERTFRRAGLPLSYSEGFNPRPVINLASPLPLGFISTAEIGDFWLSENIPQEEILSCLNNAVPPGLVIQQIDEIEQIHGNKLPGLVERSEYSISLTEEIPDLDRKITALLDSFDCIRARKGKEYDLRPLIHNIRLETPPAGTPASLIISVYTLPTGTGRPDEVLAALEISPHETIICRTAIILKTGAED
jgi:radical SAM-linked protein